MARLWLATGAIFGFLSVVMAAVVAHALDEPAARSARSGVEMQGWHAIMLVVCGLWRARGGAAVDVAGACLTVGVLLFCGSVYAGALGGVRIPLAPVGGVILMVGWLALAASARFA